MIGCGAFALRREFFQLCWWKKAWSLAVRIELMATVDCWRFLTTSHSLTLCQLTRVVLLAIVECHLAHELFIHVKWRLSKVLNEFIYVQCSPTTTHTYDLVIMLSLHVICGWSEAWLSLDWCLKQSPTSSFWLSTAQHVSNDLSKATNVDSVFIVLSSRNLRELTNVSLRSAFQIQRGSGGGTVQSISHLWLSFIGSPQIYSGYTTSAQGSEINFQLKVWPASSLRINCVKLFSLAVKISTCLTSYILTIEVSRSNVSLPCNLRWTMRLWILTVSSTN